MTPEGTPRVDGPRPWDPVLEFWFGPPGTPPLGRSAAWFSKDPAFDRAVRERFEALVGRAAGGGLDAWSEEPRGALARIVLLDQFPRNMYRGEARAFAYDAFALTASREAQERGFDRDLALDERWFVYLPMMHAEDIEAQDRCVAAFLRLVDEAPAALRGPMAGALEFARRHRHVIDRFGRFPHRNAALGRPSTPEEVRYLSEPGAGF